MDIDKHLENLYLKTDHITFKDIGANDAVTGAQIAMHEDLSGEGIWINTELAADMEPCKHLGRVILMSCDVRFNVEVPDGWNSTKLERRTVKVSVFGANYATVIRRMEDWVSRNPKFPEGLIHYRTRLK
jgi:hypothetical protein